MLQAVQKWLYKLKADISQNFKTWQKMRKKCIANYSHITVGTWTQVYSALCQALLYVSLKDLIQMLNPPGNNFSKARETMHIN